MPWDYSGIRDGFGADMIADAGQAMTWTPVSGSTYDASTGTATETAGTPVVVSGVVKEYSERDVDGTLITTKDKKIVVEGRALAAAGVTPSEDDRVSISGVDYQVVRLMPKSPAGVAIVYEAQVRAL
jgi:hypothetical protein